MSPSEPAAASSDTRIDRGGGARMLAAAAALERFALGAAGLLRLLAWLGGLAALVLAWRSAGLLGLGPLAIAMFAVVLVLPALALALMYRLLAGLAGLPARVRSALGDAQGAVLEVPRAARGGGRFAAVLGLARSAWVFRGLGGRARGVLAATGGARVVITPPCLIALIGFIALVLVQLLLATLALLTLLAWG